MVPAGNFISPAIPAGNFIFPAVNFSIFSFNPSHMME